MEPPKKRGLVLIHQNPTSKHCKKNHNTPQHHNFRTPNDWIKSAIDELKKIIGKKDVDKTTVLCLRLVINFLEVASKALGAHK